MANSPSGEPPIARFDRVLDAFGPAHPQLTFREVCAATRLPPSTAHRFLGT
ncbi:helix-turn-helix domain-containing protein [Kocuria rhizophila]|uniref:helix-turn-helix domain-containing protein n=1 Tax=Kocuria rhizophila TaxID=72000 RepID=UPI000A6C3296|nr:helix-turn-helix domain-containing protein [Kocuria rhizophila]